MGTAFAAMACCGACGSACGKTNRAARAPYVVLMFLMVVLALVLRYWGGSFTIHLNLVGDYPLCTGACAGNQGSYRISFTMFLFFTGIALMSLCSGCATVHTSFWFLKTLMLLGILVLSFLVIPNQVFDVYAQISRYLSFIFLVFQLFILVNMFYDWHVAWRPSMDDDAAHPLFNKIIYIVVCLGGLAGCIAVLSLCFGWYGGSGCSTHTFHVTFTLVIGLIMCILPLLKCVQERNDEASLLPSIAMLGYTTYLLQSGLYSSPDQACNKMGEKPDTVQMIIGIILAGCSVAYLSYSVESSLGGVLANKQTTEEKEDPEAAKKDAKDKDKDKDEEISPEQQKKNSLFHALMAFTAMYECMLLTNWGFESTNSNGYQTGYASMYVKLASGWMCMLLYFWTIIAPFICPHRFGVQAD